MSDAYDYDLFISHSLVDKEAIQPLIDGLRANGLKLWFDHTVMSPGASISEAIVKGVGKSRRALFFLSKSAVESEWVHKEIRLFIERDPANIRNTIIPVKVSDCIIPLILKDIHVWELTDDVAHNIAQLVGAAQRTTPLSFVVAAKKPLAPWLAGVFLAAGLLGGGYFAYDRLEQRNSQTNEQMLQVITLLTQNKQLTQDQVQFIANQQAAAAAKPDAKRTPLDWLALGAAALKSGDSDRAEDHLTLAASLAPNDPLIWGELSRLRRARGDLPAARLAAERAVAKAQEAVDAAPQQWERNLPAGFSFAPLTNTRTRGVLVAPAPRAAGSWISFSLRGFLGRP